MYFYQPKIEFSSYAYSISCCKYTEINNCVVRGVLAENRLFLEKQEVLSRNIFATPLKMLRIVFALPFLPPGCLRQWNLTGKSTSFDHACTSAPLLIYWQYFTNIVCVCICLHVYVRVFVRACISACMYVHVQSSCLAVVCLYQQ